MQVLNLQEANEAAQILAFYIKQFVLRRPNSQKLERYFISNINLLINTIR